MSNIQKGRGLNFHGSSIERRVNADVSLRVVVYPLSAHLYQMRVDATKCKPWESRKLGQCLYVVL